MPKYNSRFRTLLIIFIQILLSSHLFGCSAEEKPLEKSEVILNYYPDIAEAISDRDFSALLEFTEHSNPSVASLAWRALAKTDTEDLDLFVNRAVELDNSETWFALSFHPISEDQLNKISEAYISKGIESDGVCEVFRRHGQRHHLELLLDDSERLFQSEGCALAAGTILTRVEIPDDTTLSLYTLAFDAQSEAVRRNIIYGFYRAAAGGPPHTEALSNEISRVWSAFGIDRDPIVDKYMVRILGQRTLPILYNRLGEWRINQDVQLSIEMARALAHSSLASLQDEILEYLLFHENKLVREQTLESLGMHEHLDPELLQSIEDKITRPTRSHILFVQSLSLLHNKNVNINPYKRKLEFTAVQNPYLLDRVFPLLRELQSDDEYYERLVSGIEYGGITGMHSMRALGNYWRESGDAFRNAQIRRLINSELDRGERSVVAGMQQILMDDDLILDDEYNWMLSAYQRFAERGERDNYRMVEQILEGRFPDRFEKLEQIGNEPFRTPDWQRLYDMGTRPHWVLETSRGTIEVRLDPHTAPFTVSSIDSLTRAGAYDGVTFHRVVKNFVIQSGDFDRRDGFGGPDYRLPTEPSYSTFERGAAGIASSGTDTEGSQFFFMHQWAPHLDGHYTRFGEVVRGMEVVDKIQVGDTVEKARMSIR